jgi:hypothetical protein
MATWTNNAINTGDSARLSHATDLVNNINTLITTSGMSSKVNRPAIDQTKITSASIINLRKAINALEGAFSNNCCEGNRCQTCQSNKAPVCQMCQSCQSQCNCYSDCNCD